MVPLQNISKGAITMDYIRSTTTEAVRKSGKHLTLDERGQIQALHREGFSLRAIAARIGCSHTAIYYELITVDNGTEFETFTQLESLGTKVYFAPPRDHGNVCRTSDTTASSANISPKEWTSTDTVTRASETEWMK